MTWDRTRKLLVAWWCATVVPGIAVALLLPDDFVDGAAVGIAVVAWTLGYVAQLLVFMALTRRLEGVAGMAVVWFVVSLLPWAVDWSLLASWWAGLAFVGLTTAVAVYLDLGNTSAAELQRDGRPATAVVLEVKTPLMNVVVNNVYVRRKLRIRVERDDSAPPYETTYADLFLLGELPDPGDRFRVVVDPKRPQRLAPASASTPAAPQNRQPQQSSGRAIWKFTSWHGPASSTKAKPRPRARPTPRATYAPYRPTPAHGESNDLRESLQELAALHERGQLTDEEFTLAKRQLLGGAADSAPPE